MAALVLAVAAVAGVAVGVGAALVVGVGVVQEEEVVAVANCCTLRAARTCEKTSQSASKSQAAWRAQVFRFYAAPKPVESCLCRSHARRHSGAS